MGKIFSTTNYYFMNNNKPIFNKKLDSDFEKMKANTKKLIEFFIKKQLQKQSLSNNEKKEYKSIYNICKSFVTYIKKDCNLLYDFELLKSKSKEKAIISEKFGFNDKDINEYGLQEYIYGKDHSCIFNEKKIKDLFLNLTDFIGPIQYLIKAKESLLEIYNLFEALSKRNENDWNNFKVEKI